MEFPDIKGCYSIETFDFRNLFTSILQNSIHLNHLFSCNINQCSYLVVLSIFNDVPYKSINFFKQIEGIQKGLLILVLLKTYSCSFMKVYIY